MQAYLIDAFRTKSSIALWLKTSEGDIVQEFPWRSFIYLEDNPRALQAIKHMPWQRVEKTTYNGEKIFVLKVETPLDRYEQFVLHLEELTRFRVPLFNADIPPEQDFLFRHRLTPCTAVMIEGNVITPSNLEGEIPFSEMTIQVFPATLKGPIKAIRANDKMFTGEEKDFLRQFTEYFHQKDPDIISINRAFQVLPHIARRLKLHSINCKFHRWHDTKIQYKGGRSFWTYGQVRYQDYAVRLHGRFLLDKSNTVGSTCDPEAIVELCRLSGNRFQQLASRSFGAVFQANLVRQLVQNDILVPYKEKPIEPPLSMREFLDGDRAGHTYDPLIGFHTDVAEIDFASMYPWLIYNHNISADTILSEKPPFAFVPGTHIRVSMAKKGYTPLALKPLLDRRMWYKRNPSTISKKRASGLKWVLVSCYGYLRFREFKLGLPSAHMAICAYAREKLLTASYVAEERNFRIIHGIIDALYIQKRGITEEEVREACRDIELATGIPMSFEGLFRWVVFLPSINDSKRPVPTRYYGVFRTGEIKVRGIELRQHSTPRIVKQFQKACIETMATVHSEQEVVALLPAFAKLLRATIASLPTLRSDQLTCTIRASKTTYKNDIPQKRIVQKLKAQGMDIQPGMSVQFLYSTNGAILPEEYAFNPDVEEYTKRLVRALFVLLQPFNIEQAYIEEYIQDDVQLRLQK